MRLTLVLFALIFTIGFSSCKKEDNSSGTIDFTTAPTGNWKVSFYKDRDKDETSDYNSYTFSFKDDHSFVASSSSTQYTGSWLSDVDDSKDKLVIAFSSPERLQEISEDWEILSQSSSKIELYHKSGGDGHESYLTFEKK